MDVAPNSASRPEDVLHELAAGHEEIGERLLRLARAAGAIHRESVLDLLSDDAPPNLETPHSDLNSAQVPARLQLGERDESSPRGCDLQVATAIRRTEVAR